MITDKDKPHQRKAQRDLRNAQPHTDQGRHYQSFLLRCWAELYGEEVTWRFSLEAIPSGERIGFAKPEEILDFLGERTACHE
ncbi:hypothetical protein KFU94_10215 [Chloroflexi bacterium TSY]|nr:hypothetical protein [Chloroflexi bacterium TSY]